MKIVEKRTVRVIRNAYENVPFYREKYDAAGINIKDIKCLDDIKRLPFITKDEVRENFPDRIVALGTDRDKCHYSATTGSTGRSLPFLYSMKTFAFYLTTSLRVYTMFGYRPWHKAVYIKYTAVSMPSFGSFFRTAHILSILPVEEQINMLKKEKPDLLVGYASIILEIARSLKQNDLEHIRPKFIGINSELSTQDERDYIRDVFGCPVYDEYSTEETWMVTSQCRKHRYHLFIDNVWVEFLDQAGNDVEPGQVGEMVLTTQRSPVMPFIRYRIGDLGRQSVKKCTCGRGFPVVESFEGRADDSFILPSGRFVSSLKLLNTFTMYIKKYLHLMEEFRFIQKSESHMVIELVKGKEYSEERFGELIGSLRRIFNEPVRIEVEMVRSIPGSGIKRKAIESWVNRKEQKEAVQL